jgi:ethanolamine utilization microcompartment shell protein EutS
MWRRMKEAGVRIGFIDRVVGRHYLEGGGKRE